MSNRLANIILPLMVFLCLSGFTIILWRHYEAHLEEMRHKHIETTAGQIQLRMEDFLEERLSSLEVIAARWVERRPSDFSYTRYRQFAETYFKYYPGFHAINWIDSGGVIRWVYPEENYSAAKDKDLHDYPEAAIRESFARAERDRKYVITPCVTLFQGGIGFASYWPVIYDGELQGYIHGVFSVRSVVGSQMGKSVLCEFRLAIYEGDRLIYQHAFDREIVASNHSARVIREIHFRGKSWRIELEPLAITAKEGLSAYLGLGDLVHLTFLFFGLTLSTGLSFLLYSFMQRMQMYRVARDQALYEVKERKKTEKEREALLKELSDKNAELESFVYTVSHDLKTPIVTIEGFIGALREDFDELLGQDGERYMRRISEATQKMQGLINDLLDLSRVGRVTEKKVEISFAELVKEAVRSLHALIKKGGIIVEIPENMPFLYGEKKRLGQVVDNLIANAVKYIGKDNPSPRIEVGAEKRGDETVFFVRDNGIGIDEMYFDRIFNIFQRLPAAKKIDGTGIGLTIVKRIVELHGGRVWIESEVGKGSTFYFTVRNKEEYK
jgi:signal transduction histidine kinase